MVAHTYNLWHPGLSSEFEASLCNKLKRKKRKEKGNERGKRELKGGEEKRVLNYFCLILFSAEDAGMERKGCLFAECTTIITKLQHTTELC